MHTACTLPSFLELIVKSGAFETEAEPVHQSACPTCSFLTSQVGAGAWVWSWPFQGLLFELP